MPPDTISAGPEALRSHLETLRDLRGRDASAGPPPRLAELKRWQSDRLARTYTDLSAQPRYRQATTFFLEDLYGPKDFSARDAEMLRIYPLLVRTLPATAVETASLAIEVDALSESLDRRTSEALPPGPIHEASYARAYRAASTPAERERQIELIAAVGERLDRLVKKPMVYRTLKLMRTPARLAGLADLQTFLERGFASFREMDGAEEFLATIAARERAIAKALFSSQVPFSA
ncbi:FFLEELY motif protein [Usitatibacter palustris]|uniref:DUF8198 domain-containing protein n=1 Tax=Usitatibacter palustris TaxID=2732487 RepID=A0A6M4H6C6_9PROT|nr:hypothetical protein [Usitatibacter palustris]QJR15176.1 hypothetical protein DSM104440_01993 [Usitatibacter palustris]